MANFWEERIKTQTNDGEATGSLQTPPLRVSTNTIDNHQFIRNVAEQTRPVMRLADFLDYLGTDHLGIKQQFVDFLNRLGIKPTEVSEDLSYARESVLKRLDNFIVWMISEDEAAMFMADRDDYNIYSTTEAEARTYAWLAVSFTACDTAYFVRGTKEDLDDLFRNRPPARKQ